MQKLFSLVCFSLALSVAAQDLLVQPLDRLEEQPETYTVTTQLGNGCSIGRNGNGDAILSFQDYSLLISDHILFDEIEAAFWLDMNADGMEDLILETAWSSGRSSWSGGWNESFKYTSVIDMHQGVLLFSIDYHFELNSWSNDLEWTEDESEDPVIIDGTGSHERSVAIPFYSPGRLYFVMKEQTEEPLAFDQAPAPAFSLYTWNGRAFQEEQLLTRRAIED